MIAGGLQLYQTMCMRVAKALVLRGVTGSNRGAASMALNRNYFKCRQRFYKITITFCYLFHGSCKPVLWAAAPRLSPPRCTKCNSQPINGHAVYQLHIIRCSTIISSALSRLKDVSNQTRIKLASLQFLLQLVKLSRPFGLSLHRLFESFIMFVQVSTFSFSLLSFIDMSACSVFIVVCLFCILSFICILCSYCCLIGILNLMIKFAKGNHYHEQMK